MSCSGDWKCMWKKTQPSVSWKLISPVEYSYIWPEGVKTPAEVCVNEYGLHIFLLLDAQCLNSIMKVYSCSFASVNLGL